MGGETAETIGQDARAWLLKRVRDVLEAHLSGQRIPPPDGAPPEDAQRPAGCFVTLHGKDSTLRGCIGTFDATRPLWQVVDEMAIAAATRDPRFVPVTLEELPELHVEISVLHPREPIRAEEVEVGRHGLAIRKGLHHGVLLPQVPVEHGWDRETFLDHLCLKAGLPPGCWRDPDARLEAFEATVFGEEGG